MPQTPGRYNCAILKMKLSRRALFSLGLILGITLVIGFLIWSGIWIPNRPSHAAYPIRGIDVSHHQHDIDWNSVKASGIQFAYIKATEGADFRDEKFLRNWRDSHAAGIVHGAYHFFTFASSGKAQAANFIATVPVESLALPPAIDLEVFGPSGQPSPKKFQLELEAFSAAIAARFGKAPVIYTVPDFQKTYLDGIAIERLWIREVVIKPRQRWMFWQFSPRGRVPGVPTFVDLNVFNGEPADFEMLLK